MRELKIHELKTHSKYFGAVASGEKTFELRKNDRDFQKRDILRLVEWSKEDDIPLGYHLNLQVKYILHGPAFGLQEGHCIMALVPPVQFTPGGWEVLQDAPEQPALITEYMASMQSPSPHPNETEAD